MKKLLVFILLLLNSFSYNVIACGYEPYGEDVRYSLYKPTLFNFGNYNVFNYNSDLWSYDYYPKTTFESNVYDWYNYTNKKVPIESINYFLNFSTITDLYSESDNDFIHYLYKKKDFKALNYLKIAKRCESINTSISENVWELEKPTLQIQEIITHKDVLKALQNENNPYLKRKYAFQAIRMAFYLEKFDTIEALFKKHFATSQKDYLYYWSLYFYCFTSPVNKELLIAEIFNKSPEKSYAVYYYFHENYNFNKALAMAKTNKEKANIYIYISLQKVDNNLNNLKKIASYQLNSKVLDQLLVREINKIEDWIYTPYYTFYAPTVYYETTPINNTILTLRNRSENDRLYAKEVLDFINSIDCNETNNPELWQSAKIQLQFLSKEYDNALKEIKSFENRHSKNNKLNDQIEKIKALCILSNQENGKAIIPSSIENIIIKHHDDAHFIFALGRELEYRGNLPDAMALISSLELKYRKNYYEAYNGNENVEWQGNRLKNSNNLPYFSTYLDYLDFVYSAQELKQITDRLKSNFDSSFKQHIYSKLIKDQNYLIDLLGTKYLRENNLQASLLVFRSLNQKYWDDNFNGWERDIYSEYTFDQNPFYTLKHTEDFIPHLDKFIVNKKSVLEHLIYYINLSENSKTKDRAYYAFLVANCYYNMGQYGNSWMMRRTYSSYWRTDDDFSESYIDENEYRRNNLAVMYYKKAYEYSNSPKFKALCLRMVDFVNSSNGKQTTLSKDQFPEYESDLSSCDNLAEYFKSR